MHRLDRERRQRAHAPVPSQGSVLQRVHQHLSRSPQLSNAASTASGAADPQTSWTTTVSDVLDYDGPRGKIFETSAPALTSFDLKKFCSDGFYVWEATLTKQVCRELTSACQRVQNLNDQWITADWDALDWTTLRAASTPEGPDDFMNPPGWTAADLQLGVGATHALPTRNSPFSKHGYRRPQWDHPRVPVLQGFPPEMFPAGYDEYIMKLMLHPQMLTLHKLMIGDTVRFDHNTLLNRKGGYPGTPWHGHPHHEDGLGVTRTIPSIGQVRTLCYPEGFNMGQDGGLRVVPGGHLYRQASLKPSSDEANSSGYDQKTRAPIGWTANDKDFENLWLAEKCHPLTGGAT